MKKTKSLTIVKMIQNGLNKFAKTLKIKPYLLYIILGLIAVILISLGLGTRKEGYTSMNNATSTLIKTVDDMNNAINSVNWNGHFGDKEKFIKNINTFYNKKMQFLTQGDTTINDFDKAGAPSFNFTGGTKNIIPNPKPDGNVYKLDAKYDISGNVLPRYVDNDVDPGFEKYTLESTISNPIKQTDVDAAEKAIMDQINFFSVTEQKKLTDAFAALSKSGDDINKYITTALSGTVDNEEDMEKFMEDYQAAMSNINIDPENILSSSMKTGTVTSGTVTAATALALAAAGSTSQAGSPSQATLTSSVDSATSDWDKKYGQIYGQAYGQGYKQGYGQGYVQSHSYGQSGNFDTYRLANTYRSPDRYRSSNIPPGSEDLYMLKTQALPPSNPPGAAYYSSDARTAGASRADSSRADSSRADSSRADSSRADSSRADSSKAGANNSGFSFGSSPDLDAYNKANPSPTQNCSKPAVVPPCPPCERCPEPSFDCKRVPNYNSAAINQFLPQPVLADFSQFGM